MRLLSIYEQEREWQRALDACDEVERATGTPMRIVAAHYCCELAEEAVPVIAPPPATGSTAPGP